MSKEKNLKKIAADIFEANPNITEIYMTVDGQAFTSEEKAKDNARYHKDKSVKHFAKNSEEAPAEEAPEDDREALMNEYEELFGEKAAHNIGIPKLKEKIAAKKAELDQ
jgi:hypothetical protein